MIKTIKKAKWQGVRLSVADEARRLSQHPACQLSLDEIKDEILLLAVSERMPMEPELHGSAPVLGAERKKKAAARWRSGLFVERDLPQWWAETLLAHSVTSSPGATRLMSPRLRMPTIRLLRLMTGSRRTCSSSM